MNITSLLLISINHLLRAKNIDTSLAGRDGSGRLFLGPGGPRASIFWPGRASGQHFLASGLFGPPILAHFRPIFADFSAQSANYEVRARSGYPKFGPGRAGPTKKHGPRAKFRAGPRPDPSLVLLYFRSLTKC